MLFAIISIILITKSFCLCHCNCYLFGCLNCQDKTFANDTNSPSGPLLSGDMSQGEKNYKDRKEYRDKCRVYRKYSELTPPTVPSCYDNYGLV